MKRAVVVLFALCWLIGCARPIPPLPASNGPELSLVNCTDYPSILLFDYRHLGDDRIELASMTTRNIFVEVTSSDLLKAIAAFCHMERPWEGGKR
ncbi:MAG: hypothetical protein ACR2PS_09865 [Pseudomonadales bacterium]